MPYRSSRMFLRYQHLLNRAFEKTLHIVLFFTSYEHAFFTKLDLRLRSWSVKACINQFDMSPSQSPQFKRKNTTNLFEDSFTATQNFSID